MKYAVVTGGVVSGLGKGITISSIGRIMKACGLSVTAIKIDPYLNVDAGTMSPFEHGETFVLNDGGETDLDLGNYERFLDIVLTGKHNITTGKVYNEALKRERRGDYLGKTVQIVPHVTDLVLSWIREVAKVPVDESGSTPDLCLIEVGGTVGDIESMVFLEALRQFQFALGRENIIFIHCSLVPVLGSQGEQKTKPTQHTVKELRSVGIAPDVIVCRSQTPLSEATKLKISGFCQVPPANVLAVHDVSNIYHVPLILAEQNVADIIRKQLKLDDVMLAAPQLDSWRMLASRVDFAAKCASEHAESKGAKGRAPAKIAIVGKYTDLQDAYLSVVHSLRHSAIHLADDIDLELLWVEATDLEPQTEEAKRSVAWGKMHKCKGVLVPGGFGNRGIEGMVLACQYARENKKPYLGVCLGMQVMVIEFCRHVLDWKDANSAEFDERSLHQVVLFMPEINQHVMGGTMRLGARPTIVAPKVSGGTSSSTCTSIDGSAEDQASIAAIVYGCGLPHTPPAPGAPATAPFFPHSVVERHRHRYEVNPSKVSAIEAAGLVFSGRDESGERMEMTELPRSSHPFYFGVQFHPEFKSRPNRPSPPFFGFVAACCDIYDSLGAAGRKWQIYETSLSPSIGSPLLKTASSSSSSASSLHRAVDGASVATKSGTHATINDGESDFIVNKKAKV